MKRHQAQYPVVTMCRLLGVSTSGYYAWRRRGRSRRALEDAELVRRILHLHRESRGTYGAPRIHAELAAEGHRISRKRVARLMRSAGLRGVCRRRSVRTTTPGASRPAAPDRVNRAFEADGPDHLWVADITYVSTWEGFLYLAVVLDVWSRRIVGWSMRPHLRTELVVAALEMAIAQRRPRGAVHHSDRGSQYGSLAFGQRCRTAGVLTSMGSAGDCYDNALCESFFASLECELLDRSCFPTRDEAQAALFDYIEGWYNTRRRHSAIDYLSPLEFERRHASGAPAENTAENMWIACGKPAPGTTPLAGARPTTTAVMP